MLGVIAMMLRSLCMRWLSAALVTRIRVQELAVVEGLSKVQSWMFFQQLRVHGL